MNSLGIIPARYGSTRFPGKPLVKLGNKTMINRVYEQTVKVINNVIVATDDERIKNEVESFGGVAVMTSLNHASGTDRCCEALEKYITEKDINIDVVLNIQGDEPFINPFQIKLLIKLFDNPASDIATLITPFKKNDDLFDENKVKIVVDKKGFALYFSRSPMPYIRNAEKQNWLNRHLFFKHLGIYAYRTNVLKEITKLKPSLLEIAESLEQNRWLENGFKIKTAVSPYESIAIDTPEDLDKIDKALLEG